MIWVNIAIGLIFMAVIGVVVSLFVLKQKTEVMEVRQDKTVWISRDLKRTHRYISGYVESEKEVNGRMVLLLKPTYIGLNEKVSNTKPFMVCVTKSMIKRNNEGRNPIMFIEPYLGEDYTADIKDSEFCRDLFENRTALSMMENERNMLKNELIRFTNLVPKSIREPYNTLLNDKLKVKRAVDTFNTQTTNMGGANIGINSQRR